MVTTWLRIRCGASSTPMPTMKDSPSAHRESFDFSLGHLTLLKRIVLVVLVLCINLRYSSHSSHHSFVPVWQGVSVVFERVESDRAGLRRRLGRQRLVPHLGQLCALQITARRLRISGEFACIELCCASSFNCNCVLAFNSSELILLCCNRRIRVWTIG